MIARLLACILHLMHSLDAPRYTAQAEAISDVVTAEGPIFAGPDGALRTAMLMAAIAYRESGFNNSAIGDHGKSVCMMQILGGPRSLLTDVRACALAGYRMLRASVLACPAYPVSVYARGTCDSAQGQRISNDRMYIARSLVGVVK